MSLVVEGAHKAYPGGRGRPPVVALDGLDLAVAEGELLVVVGPSGSGKSSLLRAIAGLESLDSGRVVVGGRDVTRLPPERRDVAMVFQELALYPHLNVAGNIGFGLRARKVPKDEAALLVAEAAATLGIDALLHRRPAELSGGERQRVALARALVRRPTLFLLDEPLAALDPELRHQARQEVRDLQRRTGAATVHVTHDPVEAMAIADRVAVVREGRVEQIGSPTDVYDSPATPFVGRLFGSPPMNVVRADVLGLAHGGMVGLRPERIRLRTLNGGRLRGAVVTVELSGRDSIVSVLVGGERLLVQVDRAMAPAVGDEVDIDFGDGYVHRWASS